MKLFVIMKVLLVFAFASSAYAAPNADPDAPLQAQLGSIQVQYVTEHCGVRNVIVVASLEYFGADKTARIESYTPKINSHLFLYVSDYAAKRAGKALRNKDLLTIIKQTIDEILGENYVNEVLLLGVMQD